MTTETSETNSDPAGGRAPSQERTRQRPRDRKNRILAAAAYRFWTLGYHRVSMAEIAADVDISASALYRHFRGKQDLLLGVLDEQLSTMERFAADPDTDFVAALTEVSLKHREFGVLWEREAGHLPSDARRSLRHRLRGLAARVGSQLDEQDTADLRSWAILSIIDSPSHHHSQLEHDRFTAILRRAASAAATTALPQDDRVLPERRDAGIRPAARREALLAVAARLFAERGYPSVGLDDIGAAAGIAGPSVYNHFTTKTDVLAAALNRGNEALWLGLHHVLAAADTPTEALDGLTRHYTDFAFANRDIVSILIAQVIHLQEDRRAMFRRTQRDYVNEWAVLLRGARPELDDADAAVLARAAISLVNSLARIHHLRTRPGHVSRTATLAKAVLWA